MEDALTLRELGFIKARKLDGLPRSVCANWGRLSNELRLMLDLADRDLVLLSFDYAQRTPATNTLKAVNRDWYTVKITAKGKALLDEWRAIDGWLSPKGWDEILRRRGEYKIDRNGGSTA